MMCFLWNILHQSLLCHDLFKNLPLWLPTSAPLADHLRQTTLIGFPVIRWRPLKCTDATVPFQKGF